MITSEFRPITSGIMLEYRTDASKILKAAGGTSNEELSKFFIYAGNDGIQYLVEQDTFKNTLFPGSVAADNYFPGQDGEKYFNYQTINANYGDPVLGEEIGFNRQVRLSNESTKRITNFMKVGTILKSDDYNNIVANTELYNSTGLTIEEAKHGYRSAKLFHDTIRIYLATGYVLNSISGLNVKVSVPINKALYFYSDDTMDNTTYNIRYRNVNSKLYLLNWYLPKEMMKDNDSDGNPYIHWLASPLYMNSRFFDRYIEIKVPAPRSLYINESLYKDSIDDLQKYKDYIKNIGVDYVYSHEKPNGDILYYHGVPEKNSMINIEVATVSNDYLDFLDNETSNYYECTFNTDPTKVISLSGVSITNMFNALMYEDINAGYIVYQPVWGDATSDNNLHEFDINQMLQIESGVIPMVQPAEYDTLNDGIDDFIETYGDDVYKWIIINELSASYYYRYIIDPDDLNEDIQPYTEYYTNTIDYTGKTEQHGEFWKSYFIPHIRARANMTIDFIALKYTVHLYNRMNNRDIIKTSSIIIDNPLKYTLKTINTTNITNFKIVNKVIKQDLTNSAGLLPGTTAATPEVIERNVRAYYSNQDILVKLQGSSTIQGQGDIVLELYRKSHNYRFNIYIVKQDGTRIPYDMSGLQEYKLCFPVLNNNGTGIVDEMEIFPVLSSIDNNFAAGQLMFYITEALVKQIMAVPASERYFSFTTHNANGQDESVIFEGRVRYITN